MFRVIEELLNNESPYSLEKEIKHNLFLENQEKLFDHHKNSCKEYKNLFGNQKFSFHSLSEIPFIPVRLFKMLDLISIHEKNIFRTMTSSGTSGQSVSKIFLDKNSAYFQSKVLAHIVSEFIGKKRLPMLIVDQENILKSDLKFSARAAGILGFSTFGKKPSYALDNNLLVKEKEIKRFLAENDYNPLFLFGFTFIVYKYFSKVMESLDFKFPSGTTLIHGGGWKKLFNERITNDQFKKSLYSSGISNVHDYYGMIEQTGSIFMECEQGFFHCSNFSEIVIRDDMNHQDLGFNKKGIIQVLSLLPISYPGQSLLTEDMGQIFGEDDCECGRKGKYFKVYGRMKAAEIRGCSDVRQA